MKTILVIDDEEPIRKLLHQYLSSEGYEVFEAPEGNTGVGVLNANPIDLIITDLIMPGKEGLETIAEIRKLNPELPIIAMTGGGVFNDPEVFIQVAKKFGAQRGLQKPFERADLLNAVKDLLSE